MIFLFPFHLPLLRDLGAAHVSASGSHIDKVDVVRKALKGYEGEILQANLNREKARVI